MENEEIFAKGGPAAANFLEIPSSPRIPSQLILTDREHEQPVNPPKIGSVGRSSVLSRVQNFLPKMEQAHKELQKVYLKK